MFSTKLPLPFTITVNAVAYDGGSGKPVFRSQEKLIADLKALVKEHIYEDAEVDVDITTHTFSFRPREQW